MVRRLHISRARFQSHFSRYGAGCFPTLGAGYTFSRAWPRLQVIQAFGLAHRLIVRVWPGFVLIGY